MGTANVPVGEGLAPDSIYQEPINNVNLTKKDFPDKPSPRLILEDAILKINQSIDDVKKEANFPKKTLREFLKLREDSNAQLSKLNKEKNYASFLDATHRYVTKLVTLAEQEGQKNEALAKGVSDLKRNYRHLLEEASILSTMNKREKGNYFSHYLASNRTQIPAIQKKDSNEKSEALTKFTEMNTFRTKEGHIITNSPDKIMINLPNLSPFQIRYKREAAIDELIKLAKSKFKDTDVISLVRPNPNAKLTKDEKLVLMKGVRAGLNFSQNDINLLSRKEQDQVEKNREEYQKSRLLKEQAKKKEEIDETKKEALQLKENMNDSTISMTPKPK